MEKLLVPNLPLDVEIDKVRFPLSAIDQEGKLLGQIDLSHVFRMTNTVGIVQHALYATPQYQHGYSLDDQVRALMLAVIAHDQQSDPQYAALIHTYLAYIAYMKTDDGYFRNFLSFDHQFVDEKGTEDALGRTMMALGFALKYNRDAQFDALLLELFRFGLRKTRLLKSVKAASYAILGLLYYLEKDPFHGESKEILEVLGGFLRQEYAAASDENWEWFEEVLSYDNAMIPLSVLRLSRYWTDAHMEQLGLQSASFLLKHSFESSVFSPVGNEAWWKKGSQKSLFGQQAIEVPSTLLLLEELYFHTRDTAYLEQMPVCFQWFLGRNRLSIPLFDPHTKGCKDGLEQYGVNENQGAESVLSFWLAYAYMFTPYH
jgi:hypothetical protein